LKKVKNSFQVGTVKKPATKRKPVKVKRDNGVPGWFLTILFCLLLGMVAIAVNMRAFADMKTQSEQQNALQVELEKLTEENLVLEGEIEKLKSDPATIEKEARKIGMSRPNDKILVPSN